MVINGTLLEWGNSFGIRLKKSDLEALHLRPHQQVQVQITKIDNPLVEMFGWGKRNGVRITHDDVKRLRREMEGQRTRW